MGELSYELGRRLDDIAILLQRIDARLEIISKPEETNKTGNEPEVKIEMEE